MFAHPILNITDLCFNLEKSSNKETAMTISKAFEALVAEQGSLRQEMKNEVKVEVKTELTQEFKLVDVATKKDLEITKLELQKQIADTEKKIVDSELRLIEKISHAKWQVVGFILSSALVIIAAPLFLHHFGIV